MMITDLKNVDMNTLAILIIFNEEEKFKEAYRRKLGTSFVANKIFKINSLNFDSPKTNLELWQIDLYRTLELRSITSFDKSFIKFLLEGQYKNDDWLIQHLVRQYFLTEITLQTFTSFVKPNDPRSLIFKSQSTGLIQTINQTTKFDYLFSMCFANLLYLTPGISADFDDIKQYLHLTNSLCDELPESNKSVSYFYWSVVTVAQHKFTDNDKIGYIQELVTRILHYHIPAQKFFLEPEQFANENFINFWNDVKDKYKPYLCTKVTNVNEISGNEPIEVIPYLLNQMFLKFDFEQRKNILSKLKNKLKDLDFNNKELNGNVIVAMIETAMSCNEFSDLEEMLEEWSFVCIEENGTVPEYVDYIWNE
ncbi:hypothetical protein GPJ56_006502 [Histomonas meleagridis]|uniref:uncharacterized protein n=1 Tax=Histomonas meleagridis TaxID=135588 RepID=UPI00355A1888|nr:hypothetical protein GPJ56_006502 [Histomonas meleagridis]KAH0801739.1 hypothetical protein GO595_005420 [Histomonas meleagridis]